MINKYKILTNRILQEMIQTEQNQRARFEELQDYDGLYLKRDKGVNGNCYYAVTKGEDQSGVRTYKYLGKDDNKTVLCIKELRYLEKSLKVIDKNICALKRVLANLKAVDSDSINKLLPETYRGAVLGVHAHTDSRAAAWKREAEARKAADIAVNGVFHPEELTNPTDDSTMVRSKSEAIIYNLLLRLGITFVYELPVKTKFRTRYPDFTLLSEVDYKTVILIEHQGMMDTQEYRDRHINRVHEYLLSGYVAGINIFYTYDDRNGSINTNPILDIIKLKIRPPELYI